MGGWEACCRGPRPHSLAPLSSSHDLLRGVRTETCQNLVSCAGFFGVGGVVVCLLAFQQLVDVCFLWSEWAEHAEGVACLTVCCLTADCWLTQVFLCQGDTDRPCACRGPEAGLFGQSGVVSGVLGCGGSLGCESGGEDRTGGVWFTGGGGGVKRLRLEPLVEVARDELGRVPPLPLVLTHVPVT